MKQKITWSGRARFYLKWPLFLLILMLIMDAVIVFVSPKAGLIAAGFTVIYLSIFFVLFFIYKPAIMKELVAFASQYGQIQRHMLETFDIPYGILDVEGRIIWMNYAMQNVFHKDARYNRTINDVIKEIKLSMLPHADQTLSVTSTIEEKDYRIEIKRIRIDEWQSTTDLISVPEEQSFLYTVYLYDITELNKYIRMNEEQQLVVGLVYIDNYEEVLDSMDDVRRSLLLALVDRKINKFISKYQGIVKKLEKDKYYLVIQKKYLQEMQKTRFDLLEDVKTVNVGNDMKLTISIGIGINGDTYLENYNFAHAAMDLALGRGGDQAVINDQNQFSYFGGKSLQIQKNTRVRARVKAQALLEFINSCDDLIIMGHKVTDIDTFGAAIGIYRAAKHAGKRAYILIDKNSHSIHPYLSIFNDSKEYEPDMFISHSQADSIMDSHTILVVVDTNRPSNSEYPALLDRAETIVVFDHHRQGSDVIKNATLSYIEPYASSACEMIAEILQYFDDGIKLPSNEADCVYAGIIVDTNNFLAKTGIRTFEAAAYLRRCGADVSRVRKMMRNDITDYKARAEAIYNSSLYREYYAIGSLNSENLESPTIVGAQAANELLNMVGVKASFILSNYHNTIFISARSIDEVNVQIIMERLGGGGHMNIAGAQLKDITIEEAMIKLKNTLDIMIEEKAI